MKLIKKDYKKKKTKKIKDFGYGGLRNEMFVFDSMKKDNKSILIDISSLEELRDFMEDVVSLYQERKRIKKVA